MLTNTCLCWITGVRGRSLRKMFCNFGNFWPKKHCVEKSKNNYAEEGVIKIGWSGEEILKGRGLFFHQAGDKPNLSPNENTGVCKHFPIKPSHFWGKLTTYYTMKATIESHNTFSSLQRAQNSLPYPKKVSKVQYWWVIGCQNFRENFFFFEKKIFQLEKRFFIFRWRIDSRISE